MSDQCFVRTNSGHRFDILDAKPEDIRIGDIAVSLSRQNRYLGHTTKPYTVAQHSVLVSRLLEPEGPQMALAGLFHDAHEAYVGDIPAPLKSLIDSEVLDLAIGSLDEAIESRFKLDWCNLIDLRVQRADMAMAWFEVNHLLPGSAFRNLEEWAPYREAADDPSFRGTIKVGDLEPWDPLEAESRFLSRYQELRSRLQEQESDQASQGNGAVTVTTSEAIDAEDDEPALEDYIAHSGAVRSADVDDYDFCSAPLVGLLGMLKIAGQGGKKYGRFNYMKGFPVHVTINHAIVHAIRWLSGDRSEAHLEKAAWGFLVAAQTAVLNPELVDRHTLGPGATVTPEVESELQDGKAERDRKRREGQFEELFRWTLEDLPEVQEVLAARRKARSGQA